jgi:hypothetical protein
LFRKQFSDLLHGDLLIFQTSRSGLKVGFATHLKNPGTMVRYKFAFANSLTTSGRSLGFLYARNLYLAYSEIANPLLCGFAAAEELRANLNYL